MIGRTLAHYRITAALGAGGMGEVYRARDTRLDRDVALKVLPPHAAGDPTRRRRFEQEARAAAALKHPNIVTIHSVEEEEGVLFLTMELVEGRTLSEIIPVGGLSPDRFLALAVPLAEAVSGAHARGILHRDLKPGNVMVDAGGRPKILDFGLARIWAPPSDDGLTVTSAGPLTVAGETLGTPAYMSPEQIAGQELDGRSDLFSLGIVFHEMLCGERPFRGDHPVTVMHAVLHENPLPPSVPGPIASIVDRCLRKEADERFPDADALLGALRAVAAGADTIEMEVSGIAVPDVRSFMDRGEYERAYRDLRALSERRPLSCAELEMLVECTVWVSDTDEYFRSAEKAYALHLEEGRKAAAARLALVLVAGHAEMHAGAAARGWLRKAERLLAGEPEVLEHGLLFRRQVADAMAAGDFDRAAELNRRCAEVADRLDDSELKTVALHDRGRILIHLGSVQEGTDLIDEAMASAAGGAVTPMTLGNLYCRTLTVCRMIADFDRMREWTAVASRWCRPQGASSYPGICRVHSAESMRHQGRWTEAEEAVRNACDFFERVGPPSHAGQALNELGELLLQKGDFAGAEEAFRRAHEFGHDPVPGLPLLRLALDNVAAARQVIERALGEYANDRLFRVKLLSAGIRIWIASGDLVRAEAAVDELAAASGQYKCPMFQAQAALGRGALELARDNYPTASPALREAWSVFHAAGFPYEAARARVLLGRSYRAAGNAEDARLEFESARKAFEELGARPDLESVSVLIENS